MVEIKNPQVMEPTHQNETHPEMAQEHIKSITVSFSLIVCVLRLMGPALAEDAGAVFEAAGKAAVDELTAMAKPPALPPPPRPPCPSMPPPPAPA